MGCLEGFLMGGSKINGKLPFSISVPKSEFQYLVIISSWLPVPCVLVNIDEMCV